MSDLIKEIQNLVIHKMSYFIPTLRDKSDVCGCDDNQVFLTTRRMVAELENKIQEVYKQDLLDSRNTIRQLERKHKQPTINTFEELNSILNVGFFRNIKEDDNPFIHHCVVGDLALRYYKSGVMSFCGEEFKNISPQQAYNIITALKDNLGG